MQSIAAQQANAEIKINENFATLEHVSVYGKRPAVTTGLTWGYYGGTWGGLTVADGTVTLSNAATNYVVAARATGAVSVSTSAMNWNDLANYARIYKLTTAGSAVTATEDHRAGFGGVHGDRPPPAAVTIASASTIDIPIGQRVAVISGSTTITSITATGHSGAVVTLIFQSTAGLTDGSNLKLNGNFTASADDTFSLACDGTNWYEIPRSPN